MPNVLYQITKGNPTIFVFYFGLWSLIAGIVLCLPGNSFEVSVVWNVLQSMHSDDTEWGIAMIIDGLLLVVSIYLAKIPYRAAIAATSAVMWLPIGLSMCIAGYEAGVATIVGAYSVLGSIGCMFAVEQWVHSDSRNSNHGVW